MRARTGARCRSQRRLGDEVRYPIAEVSEPVDAPGDDARRAVGLGHHEEQHKRDDQILDDVVHGGPPGRVLEGAAQSMVAASTPGSGFLPKCSADEVGSFVTWYVNADVQRRL